jgi:hypothetical protein
MVLYTVLSVQYCSALEKGVIGGVAVAKNVLRLPLKKEFADGGV